MNVLTSRQLILDVAARWKDQYCVEGRWRDPHQTSAADVYARLVALNVDTAAPKDVSAIIGNDSWSHFMCDGCHHYVTRAVAIDDCQVCASCLTQALEMLDSPLSELPK